MRAMVFKIRWRFSIGDRLGLQAKFRGLKRVLLGHGVFGTIQSVEDQFPEEGKPGHVFDVAVFDDLVVSEVNVTRGVGPGDVNVVAQLDVAFGAEDQDTGVAGDRETVGGKPVHPEVIGRSVIASQVGLAEILELRGFPVGVIGHCRMKDRRVIGAAVEEKLFDLVAADVGQDPSVFFLLEKPLRPVLRSEPVRADPDNLQYLSNNAGLNEIARVNAGFGVQAFAVVNHVSATGFGSRGARVGQLLEAGEGRFVREEILSRFHDPTTERPSFGGNRRGRDQKDFRVVENFLFGPGDTRGGKFFPEGFAPGRVRIEDPAQSAAGFRQSAALGVDVPMVEPHSGKGKVPGLTDESRFLEGKGGEMVVVAAHWREGSNKVNKAARRIGRYLTVPSGRPAVTRQLAGSCFLQESIVRSFSSTPKRTPLKFRRPEVVDRREAGLRIAVSTSWAHERKTFFFHRGASMKERATIKDIARRAGVHHSTVSRCLKDSPMISAATKDKVRRIAKQLRYRPNPWLNVLMYNRKKGALSKFLPHIAFVTFFPKPHGWKTWIPGLDNCFEGARKEVGSHGYCLEEFCAPPDRISGKRLEQILYTRGINGVILSPSPVPLEKIDWEWDRFAVVAIGPSVREEGVHRVRHDHFGAMATAMERCRQLGYSRVGLIVEEENHRKTNGRWVASYLLKQFEIGVRRPPVPLFVKEWKPSAVVPWMKVNRPDVILVVNASPIEEILRAEGLRIPDDVGVVSLACPERAGRQTGIYENWDNQGTQAAALLIDLMTDNLLGLHDVPSNLLITGVWNEGETVRKDRFKRISPPADQGSSRRIQEGIRGEGNRQTTIKDIARRAELDSSTVSLCLNDSPRVAAVTKERVRKLALEMNYRPNPFLRSLMQQRRLGRLPSVSPALAFTTFYEKRDEWKHYRNPGLKHVYSGARKQARSRGFRITEIWGQPDRDSLERVSEEMIEKDIRGVILAPLPHWITELDWDWDRFATVVVGPSLSHLPLHRVRNNHFDSVIAAMDKCRGLGYRRVGLALKNEINNRTNGRWLAAYLHKQFELGVRNPPKPLLEDSLSGDRFLRWVKRHRLDSVIVSEPEDPIQWLQEGGYTVPEDVGLVRLSCPALGDYFSGPFENWEIQGARAVNIVINSLMANKSGFGCPPAISLVKSAWNPGRTLRGEPRM